jgi:DNA gyrase/topoisomerase IV subunit B
MTLFLKFLPQVIEKGYLYVALPPLYSFSKKNSVIYIYTQAEMDEYSKTYGEPKERTRYKGLGEMNADQLWETTMDPDSRRLISVEMDDLEDTEKMFKVLMGKDSKIRREFILANVKELT